MEELHRAAREALQNSKTLQDFHPPRGPVPESLSPLWSDISSHDPTDNSRICEDLLVAQGYLKLWGSRRLSDDDETVANQLYIWLDDLALPSSFFAEVDNLDYLANDKKARIDDSRRKLTLAISAISLLAAIHPIQKSNCISETVIALASFTRAEDSWTRQASYTQATGILHAFSETRSNSNSPFWPAIEQILKDTIRPLFSKTKNPAITAEGRKNFHPVPLPRFDASVLDPETKPWKIHQVYATTAFSWITSQYTSTNRAQLESHFPLLVPPLLALIDDDGLAFKARGCSLLTQLLKPIRETNSDILKRTNLSSVFTDAVKPCLLSLPSITPEQDSIHLLSLAYPALLSILQTTNGEKDQEAYIKGITSLLRDNLIPSFHHISTTNRDTGTFSFASFPYPRLSTLLLEGINTMVLELRIHTTKYLQDLVPLLYSTLANPFGPAYLPHLCAAVDVTRTVILNAHPRLWRWRAEILGGVCSCWIHLGNEEGEIDDRGARGWGVESDAGRREKVVRLKKRLQGVVYLLRVALENPILENGDPGVLQASENFEGEMQELVSADDALEGLLFASIDPADRECWEEEQSRA